jgi:hypothetical protein
MFKMSSASSLILLSALALSLALPVTTLANVYPTNLSQSANSIGPGQNVTLGYLLNEDASAVTVDILNASSAVVRTISPGAQTKGARSVVWDGKDNAAAQLPAGAYSFRVNTTGAANAAWTQTSVDAMLNNFELPRGVGVNTNSASPFYGRVYVSNGQALPTAAGRTMSDGLYMLNADLSDAGIVGGTGPHAGGVDWTTGGSVSPFRVQVGPDDSVYITDWSDPHGGLWQAPANLSGTWTEILDSSGGRDVDGLALPVHGSISDVVITGVGAARVLYTADEDFYIEPQGPTSAGSIQKYDIGNTAVWTTAPTATFYDDAVGGFNVNFLNSLSLDKRGHFWYSQNRFAGTDFPSLVEIDATGTIIWDSLQLADLPNEIPDPLRGAQGIAYDPVNDVLAVATSTSGNIVIFDPENHAVLDQFPFDGGATNTDVVFDNVGNLYVANRSAEYVRIWSPPSSTGEFVANQFSTGSLAPLGAITLSAGLSANFDGVGGVDGRDFLIWQRNTGGPGTQPTGDATGDNQVNDLDFAAWKAQFGTGAATANGQITPEPSSAALVLLAITALATRRRRL